MKPNGHGGDTTVVKNIQRKNRLIATGSFLFVLATTGYFGAVGLHEILEFNDFEVIYLGAQLAAERSPDLYRVVSPEKTRHFLYAPSSAILLSPIARLSSQSAGIVFSLLKVGAFVFLLWGAVSLAGPSSETPEMFWSAMAGSLFIMLRPFDGDFGNGQINVIITALAVGGVWILMKADRHWWIGSLLMALAVCIKPPPGLLLLLPLIHRLWGRFLVTASLIVLVTFGLPLAWYGMPEGKALLQEFSTRSTKTIFNAKDSEDQISLAEFAVFTIAQARAEPGLVWDGEDLYRIEEGEMVEVSLPDPMTLAAGRAIWAGMAVLVLGAFLLARRWAFAPNRRSWRWDLAALCVLVIILSPVARKAHLVILFPPVAWLVCHVTNFVRAQGGIRNFVRANRIFTAAAALTVVMLYVADDLPIPFPTFPIPYHPIPFLAVTTMLGLMILTARMETAAGDVLGEPAESPGSLSSNLLDRTDAL